MSRASAKQTTITPLQLPASAAAAFDRLVREQRRAKKLRNCAKQIELAKRELETVFGNSQIGLLPDRRVLVRTPQCRCYAALPAKEVFYNEFAEIGVSDA